MLLSEIESEKKLTVRAKMNEHEIAVRLIICEYLAFCVIEFQNKRNPWPMRVSNDGFNEWN